MFTGDWSGYEQSPFSVGRWGNSSPSCCNRRLGSYRGWQHWVNTGKIPCDIFRLNSRGWEKVKLEGCVFVCFFFNTALTFTFICYIFFIFTALGGGEEDLLKQSSLGPTLTCQMTKSKSDCSFFCSQWYSTVWYSWKTNAFFSEVSWFVDKPNSSWKPHYCN